MTCVLDTDAGEAHALLDVSMHQTESLFASPLSLYEDPAVLTSVPFLYHAYEGLAPPLVIVVVNVTVVPIQIVVCDGLTTIVGATIGFTVMWT